MNYFTEVQMCASRQSCSYLLTLCGIAGAVIDEDTCQSIRSIHTDNNNTLYSVNKRIQINISINKIISYCEWSNTAIL